MGKDLCRNWDGPETREGCAWVGSWSLTVNLQDGDMLEAHQSEGQIARSGPSASQWKTTGSSQFLMCPWL